MRLGAGRPAHPGQPRIINGSSASPGEYPAQGVLRFNGGFICGGTLISNRHFLTAGHCVTTDSGGSLPVGSFSVTLGNVDRDAGQTFTFSAKEVHEDYAIADDIPDNDLALLTLSTPVPRALAEPMRLIEGGETSLWAPARQSTLIGWGNTFNSPGSDSQFLLETTAPMRSDADCEAGSAYGFDFHRATMVCAGDGTSDTCQGDSGGPMMVSDGAFLVLAGITSWGAGCANPAKPGVYTRLGRPRAQRVGP